MMKKTHFCLIGARTAKSTNKIEQQTLLRITNIDRFIRSLSSIDKVHEQRSFDCGRDITFSRAKHTLI